MVNVVNVVVDLEPHCTEGERDILDGDNTETVDVVETCMAGQDRFSFFF